MHITMMMRGLVALCLCLLASLAFAAGWVAATIAQLAVLPTEEPPLLVPPPYEERPLVDPATIPTISSDTRLTSE